MRHAVAGAGGGAALQQHLRGTSGATMTKGDALALANVATSSMVTFS